MKSAPSKKLMKIRAPFFSSKSTLEDGRKLIKDALGVSKIKQYEKYLGLPFLLGKNRRKKASFYSFKERVLMKLHGWEKQLLSQACSGVLIIAVVQAITT